MFIWSVFVGYFLELILHSVGPKKGENWDCGFLCTSSVSAL